MLVSIKVGFVETQTQLGREAARRELIDRDKIAHRLARMGLKRQILTNPLTKEEDAYPIRAEDSILLLAQDEAAARAALRRAASALKGQDATPPVGSLPRPRSGSRLARWVRRS